jgi:dihydroorotate dehydrogenase (NAD+) catalytic subunit
MEFGVDRESIMRLIGAVKEVTSRPLIAKLSPNVTSIVAMAEAAHEAGADAVSLINTLVGMAVNVHTWKPELSNVTGGLSGPAIKPVAIAMVHKVFRAVDIPIIGIGGISDWEDAVEFHLVGARGLQVGTANFIDPDATMKIIRGLSAFLADRDLRTLHDLIGQVKVP